MAFCIDLSIVVFIDFLVEVLIQVPLAFSDIYVHQVLGIPLKAFSLLGFIAYDVLMSASPFKGTLGKFFQGLEVETAAGTRLGMGRACLRTFAKCLLPFGVVFFLFDKKRRTLHDLVAGTSTGTVQGSWLDRAKAGCWRGRLRMVSMATGPCPDASAGP